MTQRRRGFNPDRFDLFMHRLTNALVLQFGDDCRLFGIRHEGFAFRHVYVRNRVFRIERRHQKIREISAPQVQR